MLDEKLYTILFRSLPSSILYRIIILNIWIVFNLRFLICWFIFGLYVIKNFNNLLIEINWFLFLRKKLFIIFFGFSSFTVSDLGLFFLSASASVSFLFSAFGSSDSFLSDSSSLELETMTLFDFFFLGEISSSDSAWLFLTILPTDGDKTDLLILNFFAAKKR